MVDVRRIVERIDKFGRDSRVASAEISGSDWDLGSVTVNITYSQDWAPPTQKDPRSHQHQITFVAKKRKKVVLFTDYNKRLTLFEYREEIVKRLYRSNIHNCNGTFKAVHVTLAKLLT